MLTTKNNVLNNGNEYNYQSAIKEVFLDDQELEIGSKVGVSRAMSFIKRGNVNKSQGDKSTVWLNNIGACLGEIAFCKMLNFDWVDRFDKTNDDSVANTGVDWFVKTTTYQNGHLIVPQGSRLDCNYVLVIYSTDCVNKFKVVGWINGLEACHNRFFNYRMSSYYVPQEQLNPFTDEMLQVMYSQYSSLNKIA